MNICFLARADSYHTQKWCRYFVSKGHNVHVISLTEAEIEGVTVHHLNSGASAQSKDFEKLKYLTQIKQVKRLIAQIKPDIINAHRAPSYGLLAALAGIKPYILSVWGSDIYDFPRRSILHRLLLRYALRKADYIFSTSKAMADETNRYVNRDVFITPFGVDCQLFSPEQRTRLNDDRRFVIGTVKALERRYGIHTLLSACAKIHEDRPDIPLEVRIAGKGSMETELKNQAKELGIEGVVTWLGFVPQQQAAEEWANMDCGIVSSVSESESFGVSAVEAQACETAVVISDIPGLMEATKPGYSSVVVPRGDVARLAEEVINLYDNPQKRDAMGKQGREFALENYAFDDCFARIEQKYNEILEKGRDNMVIPTA